MLNISLITEQIRTSANFAISNMAEDIFVNHSQIIFFSQINSLKPDMYGRFNN